MDDDGKQISPEVRRAVAALAPTLDSLEVLMLVFRLRDRPWTSPLVSQHLGLPEKRVRAVLDRLISTEILVPAGSEPGSFLFAMESEHLPGVQLIAEAYVNRRVTLINFVAAHALNALRDFASAFQIRKGKPKE